MTGSKQKRAKAGLAALAAAALLAAGSPAAAERAQAVLSVTAIVAPSCQVAHRPAARHAADIACSTGTLFSTMTATSHGEQPLDDATAILGAPVRGEDGVRFTAPLQPASNDGKNDDGDGGTRYLTITY